MPTATIWRPYGFVSIVSFGEMDYSCLHVYFKRAEIEAATEGFIQIYERCKGLATGGDLFLLGGE